MDPGKTSYSAVSGESSPDSDTEPSTKKPESIVALLNILQYTSPIGRATMTSSRGQVRKVISTVKFVAKMFLSSIKAHLTLGGILKVKPISIQLCQQDPRPD